MTSLIAWAGVDQRGPASVYLASDSRLSWNGGGAWDHGRKVFSTKAYPHLFGFCGEAALPVHALSQLVELIDAGLLFEPDASPSHCMDVVVESLTKSLTPYPTASGDGFTFVHAMRRGTGLSSAFHVATAEFSARHGVSRQELPSPAQSGLLGAWGSGAAAFRGRLAAWQSSDVSGTSRAVFSALCDALETGKDPRTGGAPQLVGLTRVSPGETFGIVWRGGRYLYGTEVGVRTVYGQVRWRNELFEICDPITLLRAVNAQPQPRPRNVR